MEKLPQFVVKRLQETPPAGGSHPDADVLTAFAEHSLAGRERALVMEHLARCGDCRDVVAMALPASETVAAPTSVSASGIGWFSWPVLRWGALAAGILAVTSAGVLQYRHRNHEKTVASNVMPQATTALNPAPSQSILPQPAPPATEMRKEALAAHKAPDTSLSLALRAGRPAGGIGGGVSNGSGIGSGASQRYAFSARAGSTLAGAAANPVPMPAPPPSSTTDQSKDLIAQSQKQLPLNGPASADINVVKAKNPVPAQAGAGAASGAQLASPMPLRTSPTVMLRPAPQWAITSAGTLQRSYDGGVTWENVNPNASPASAHSQVAAESAEHDRGPFNGLAQITGTVTDPSGAVVTTATVEMRELSTGKKRTTRTDATGHFSLSGLAAGDYEVQVSCPGFTTTSQRFALQARDRTVLAVNLAVGAASTAVEVTGAAPLVQAEATVNAEPDSTLREKKVQKIEAAVSPNPVFRAVAANGNEVWAGGSAGVLYLTTDGGNLWTRVIPSAAGATLTGDVISIQFSDAQHGKVATSTGELWITSDSGQSWSRQ